MARCIPMVMEDGTAKDNDQAVAICMSKFSGKALEEVLLDVTKSGARNNRRDAERLQNIHDYAVENGAMCQVKKTANPLKAISMNDDELRVGNYIVLFGDNDTRDLEGIGSPRKNADGSLGEFFSKAVDLESSYTQSGVIPVDWEHGWDPDGVGNHPDNVLGRVDWKSMKRDEQGVFVERVLNRRNQYVKWLEALIEAGLVGNSSEATEAVERKTNGEITRWPLMRDTLTVTPMEPRMLTANQLQAMKALQILIDPASTPEAEQAGEAAPATAKAIEQVQPNIIRKDTNTMEITEEKLTELMGAAVDKALAKLPPVTNPEVIVTKDEADQSWVGPGEFFKAVKMAAVHPAMEDVRLRAVKATGMSEGVPSDGGYLVVPQFASGILERMYSTGDVLGRISVDPVTSNSMTYNGVDETSRADGSRYGGVTSFWISEGGTYTGSKPKFRQFEEKLKKVVVLCYATDEQLEDTANMESWLNRVVPGELIFRTEDAIFNGDGVGKPLGILNSPCLNTILRVDGSEVDATDIAQLWAHRWVGLKDYVWFIDASVFPQLANMTVGNFPVLMQNNTINNLPAMSIYGRPVIETEYQQSLGTAGDIMLASMSQYQAISKGGVKSATSIHVAFTTGEQAFRFTYRIDGQPSWSSTLTTKSGTAVSPFVVLGASV